MFIKREAERYDYPTLSIYDNTKSRDFCHKQLENTTLNNSHSIIYVHIPFCANHCIFCNYYKVSNISLDMFEEYFNALHKELEYYSRILKYQTKILGVHFGGGTPSIVPVKYYHNLIKQIRKMFNMIDPVISFEGNINSLNRLDYIKGLRSAGINRISFGIQTLNPQIRSFLHLKGNYANIRELCYLLQSEGIYDINADLMFNLPFQTLNSFDEDVERAFELGVKAIDMYSLLVYPETQMYNYLHEHNIWKSYSASNSINQYERIFYKLACDKRYKFIMANTVAVNDAPDNILLKSQLGNNAINSNNVIGIGASSRGYLSGFKYKNYVNISDYIKSVMNASIGIQLCRELSDREKLLKWLVLFPNFMNINLEGNVLPKTQQERLNGLVDKGILRRNNLEYSFVTGMNFWAGNVSSQLMDNMEQMRMKEIVLKNRKNHLNMYNQDKMQIIEQND